MRASYKPWAFVLTICAALFLVLGDSGRTQEAANINARLQELQQKRLELLKETYEVATALFRNARTTYDDAHEAQVALSAARREYAATRDDRIKACDDSINEAIEWQKIVEGQVESARANRLTAMKAQAYVLEMEIAKEHAKSSE